MSRVSRILGPDGQPYKLPGREQPRRQPRVHARYDAAGGGGDNARHWANADAMSARAANSLDVRRRLRERSRYEFANNGYCQGLILTLANDLVGTGPTPCVSTEDEAFNRAVQWAFTAWWEAVGGPEKLHTLKQAKSRDGEGFWLLATGEETDDTPVSLDLREVECDQVSSPWGGSDDVDGLKLDGRGRVVGYHLLREHPGDSLGFSTRSDVVRAASVVHWFRRDRPGQYRGVPELTASLGLFAQLRRYTMAVLTAAETAASFAATLETEAAPDDETLDPTPFETLEIERGMMTTLPAGSKMSQLKPEQPVTTYAEFKAEVLKEIGRPVNAPRNVTLSDSSEYNYSSARLDHLLYRTAVRVERRHCERVVLRRVFAAWLDEAVMVPGHLPAPPEGVSWAALPLSWYWPGVAAIDPLKEANADAVNLANGTTTLQELLSEYGQDWEAFLRQRARELDLMRELGVPVPGEPAPTEGVPADG